MKPIQLKPGLYCVISEQLKCIAQEFGYNLVVHGSMSRDLDLVAIPWVNNPKPEQEMIKEFMLYLTGVVVNDKDGNVPYSILPGGRHAYTIQLNRGNKHGEWVRYEDKEYYLDISVTPMGTEDTK